MNAAALLPARHPRLEVAGFEVECVVFDPLVNRVHHLRELAAVVFDACDGTTTTASLVDELCEVLEVEPAAAQAAIESALESLREAGLLVGSEPPPDPPPCIGCGGDEPTPRPRRGFLRRRARGQ